jgi:hypothetical protein
LKERKPPGLVGETRVVETHAAMLPTRQPAFFPLTGRMSFDSDKRGTVRPRRSLKILSVRGAHLSGCRELTLPAMALQ